MGRRGLDKDDVRLIAGWLRRHKVMRVTQGVTGNVRMAGHKRRAMARACHLGGDWYAIETGPKGEREARESIATAGFEAYLPEYRVESEKRKLRKKVTAEYCLFPRYLFARSSPDQLSALKDCEGVRDILPGFPHAPVPIPADVVDKLRSAQKAMLFDDTEEAKRVRGETKEAAITSLRRRLIEETVLINDGPFKSFHAIVESVHSLERLAVLVSIFGRPTTVELELGQVAYLDGEKIAA